MMKEENSVSCPECTSQRVWKDGLRQTVNGDVQRWLCRRCGHRFSDSQIKVDVLKEGLALSEPVHDLRNFYTIDLGTDEVGFKNPPLTIGEDVGSHVFSIVGKPINEFLPNTGERQVCATESVAKNLSQQRTRTKKRAAGATKLTTNTKDLLFEFAWHMKKAGLKESTIKPRIRLLRVLIKRGSHLLDPESVREGIARQDTWCEARKSNAVSIYTKLLKMLGRKWNPPIYKRIRKLPFIPTESELDQLIAGCGKKTAAFLGTLKETGARCGEIWRLRWIDVDLEHSIITVTPEKGSNPRQFKVSGKLMAMLNALPREDERIWKAKLRTIRRTYEYSRARIAEITKNPRLKRITFHTSRHWKATMEYHKTKDILHVMRMLGHRNINNTLKYTQLIKTDDDEFISKAAKTVEDACSLIELGYEYVTEFKEQGVKLFRKRK